MSELKKINIGQFAAREYALWAEQWMLLTSGDFERGEFNTMTVAWGSIGAMWNKPFVQVVVRPTRYTYQFMEKFQSFSLCVFPEKYHDALTILGTRSGRDGDKISDAGLTPAACSQIAAPCFAEAELVFECNKIYWDDLRPDHFLQPEIDDNYPERDYHRIYFGEIVLLRGAEIYSSARK